MMMNIVWHAQGCEFDKKFCSHGFSFGGCSLTWNTFGIIGHLNKLKNVSGDGNFCRSISCTVVVIVLVLN